VEEDDTSASELLIGGTIAAAALGLIGWGILKYAENKG
jgi:hypothetical protein